MITLAPRVQAPPVDTAAARTCPARATSRAATTARSPPSRTCPPRPRPGARSERFSSWTRGATRRRWAIARGAAGWSVPSTTSTRRSSSWTWPTSTASARVSRPCDHCAMLRPTRPPGSRPWTRPSGCTTCPGCWRRLSDVWLPSR